MQVVINKFSTLVFPNCHKFASGSKHLVHSGLGMIDNSMTLKDHFGLNTCMAVDYRGNNTKYLS